LFNEENKSLSSSEWNVWIAFYSLLQIEYGLTDVDIKQLDGTTTLIVVVGDELQKVSPCMVINKIIVDPTTQDQHCQVPNSLI
jgi:hypothetical protein